MARRALAIIPAYTHIDWRLMRVLQHVGMPYIDLHGGADLVLTRSKLLSTALAGEAEYFVFIDSDVVPTARDLVELAESPKVDPDNALTGCYIVRENTLVAQPEEDTVELFGSRRFVPMLVSGMGFAAVHRASVEKVQKELPVLHDGVAGDWHPFFMPFVLTQQTEAGPSHEYLAEDYSFWWRLRMVGTRLWIDSHLVVGHAKRSIWLPREGDAGKNFVFAPRDGRGKKQRRSFGGIESPCECDAPVEHLEPESAT